MTESSTATRAGGRERGVISDPPVPGAFDFICRATQEFQVAIYSSRSAEAFGVEAMKDYVKTGVYEWAGDPTEGSDIFKLISWPTDKPPALVTIDDRAIQFTGKWPSLDELRNFKPWNKLPPARPDWIDRAGVVASSIVNLIHDHNPQLIPKRSSNSESFEEPLSLPHLLYMAVELREHRLDSETKACRWLGYLQAGVVLHRLATLEDMKELNLHSADVK